MYRSVVKKSEYTSKDKAIQIYNSLPKLESNFNLIVNSNKNKPQSEELLKKVDIDLSFTTLINNSQIDDTQSKTLELIIPENKDNSIKIIPIDSSITIDKDELTEG